MTKKILFSFIIIFLLMPVFVFAQEGPILDAANEFGDLDGNQIKLILINISEWLLVFLGVIAVIIALWSAYLFLTAGDNSEQLTKAKKTLIWAMVGVVVAIISFSIVFFTESLIKSPTGSIQITEIV